MAPLIPSAKATLGYPLFACDFDPLDSSRLFVAGGGGAGRSGVPNRITLFDTSKTHELTEAGEIELSKDEDSVTSIAVGQRKGKVTPIYAGVNSSPKDAETGKNTHFRVFGVEGNSKGVGKAANKITEASRSVLFSGREKDLYQRVTRLSKPYPNQSQLGAITTGLTKKAEIVLFDTGSTPPKTVGGFQSDGEVVDCDFVQTGKGEYLLAYCDPFDVWVQKVTAKKVNAEEPTCVYVTPGSDHFEKPTVPSFKGLRFLTKDYLIMLTNIHGSSGVVLQILRFPPSGKGHARVVQSIRLPYTVSKATGFAVANLTPPVSPSDPQGFTQFVIAVAGHDITISLFKIDLEVSAGVSMVTKIKAFRTFKAVHPIQMTAITFSNFTPPSHPVTASTPPQYLKLASVSMSNTVVVHQLPLFPVPLSVKRGQSKTPRYVVALPSSNFAIGAGLMLSVIGVCIAAIFVQGLLELRGGVPVRLNTRQYLPIPWQEKLGKPYEFPAGYSASLNIPASTFATTSASGELPTGAEGAKLAHFLKGVQSGNSDGVVVIKEVQEDSGLGFKAHVHDEDTHGVLQGTKWEDLPAKAKESWKKKLSDAGHWAEEMGETILKGVVFGELAGAVGHAVAGG